ncbi:MAG: N-acetyltransferase family protein [Candidatus Bathyarchaeia archaeon]
MSIHVRRATTDDLETLWNIERECFTTEAFTKEQLEYLLENPKGISLIACIDDEIAGFIVGVIHNHSIMRTGHVYTIDVVAKHRRKGVGLRLLRGLEQLFVENEVEICYLEARRENVAALELYQKHGYTQLDVLKDFYSQGVDGVRLMKKLPSRKKIKAP